MNACVSGDRSYWVLGSLWLLVTVPMAWLSASAVELAVNSATLAGVAASLPILTGWYQQLGTSGMYLLAAVPGVLMALSFRVRSLRLAISVLTVVLGASIYLVFFGLVAAWITFVRLSS